MSDQQVHVPTPVSTRNAPIPWRKSLSFRLGLAINLVAFLVLLIFWFADYRLERSVHLNEHAARLSEEAKVVRLAEQAFAEPAGFHRFIENYCRQMEPSISPGHHIVVTDGDGQIIESMMAGGQDDLARVLVTLQRDRVRLFQHDAQEFMMAGEPRVGGGAVVVAQSLAPVRRLIRRQFLSRAASMTVLVTLILAATNVLLVRWVRRPISKLVAGVGAIGQGRFDVRIEPLRTAEMTRVAEGINRMTESLEQAEHVRQRDMAKARRIHRALLPPVDIEIPGLTMNARYISADSVGGDYYDALPFPDGRWLLVIADVSGHGLSAALVTAMLKAEFRQFARRGLQKLEAIARVVNTELESLLGTEHFVTCFLALFDPTVFCLEYVNCGHEPGILLGGDGILKAQLESSALPLGVSANSTWESATVQLDPEDRLYLFTDGLAETPSPDGVLFGRDRLMESIQATACQHPAVQIEAVLGQIDAFRGCPASPDDVTLVIFRREP